MRVFCKYYLKKLLLQVRIKKDLSFVVINPLNSKIFNILFQNNPDTVYIYPVLSGKYLSDTPFHYPILLNHADKMHDPDLKAQTEYDYSVDIV